MFESNQFYVTDPVSGIQKLSTDPETMVYYNFILAMAAITLIGSLLYYLIVFLAEVVGHVPNWVRKLCAGKKSHTMKHIAEDSKNENSDEEIEMSELGNTNFGNPLGKLQDAKEKMNRANARAATAERKQNEAMQQQTELVNQMKRLKQEKAQLAGKNKPRVMAKRRTGRIRKEIKQRQVRSMSSSSEKKR